MKDNFSEEANKYAQFRPTYPIAFFDYLKTITQNHETAWDCGTGNGQVAQILAKTYQHVYATDISKAQLDNAIPLPNIYYSIQSAEECHFKDNFFDLIIIAQAIHWFHFEQFYKQVNRTAKNNAHIVVIGYDLLNINPLIDAIIKRFYTQIIGPYWDNERHYIDEKYQTIPFPFTEIKTLEFENKYQWNLAQLIGYLNTWSAVKHYVKANNTNPIDLIYKELNEIWQPDEIKTVNFPLLTRIGKINKT